ncbi:hypothetical protein IAT38_005584 [Cryptococcus sp. DSM 104549]
MTAAPKKPNFLVIVADDLGFSDVGCYGSEISTPNIDKLASQGVRFLDFHTAAACSPTRSMLLSGTDNHITGMGAMAEHMHDEEGKKWIGKPGHEGYMNRRVAALSEVLQDAGYHTMLSGKWHLGLEPDKSPHARGFDRSFSMLSGCHNHYAWEPQFGDRVSPEGNELTFKHFVPAIYDKKNMYSRDGEQFTPPANYPEKPGGFYSSDAFASELISYLEERKTTAELAKKPFFGYFAFTAPHWPLQAPREVREKYKGMYDEGPHALRAQRLERMKKMGIVGEETTAHPLINPLGITEWDEMTADEKAKSARSMEAFAAMVECIDTNVGRVVDKLEADGELDNTFVLFMSDNGAEGASYEAFPFFGDSIMEVINHFYDNSLDNIGEPNSFVWYGSAWAQAATAPSRLYKMFPTQGGIRVPFVLRYPPFHSQPAFTPGAITSTFTTVMDLMPTFLDLASITHPAPVPGKTGTFRGREVEPMRGASWRKWIEGKEERPHDEGIPQGWELHGRAGMRIGEWKMVWIPPPYGPGRWELFHLKSDPGETKDLAKENPGKMEELTAAWEKYVAESGVVWGNPNYGEAVADEMEDARAWMSRPLR